MPRPPCRLWPVAHHPSLNSLNTLKRYKNLTQTDIVIGHSDAEHSAGSSSSLWCSAVAQNLCKGALVLSHRVEHKCPKWHTLFSPAQAFCEPLLRSYRTECFKRASTMFLSVPWMRALSSIASSSRPTRSNRASTCRLKPAPPSQ